MPQAIAMLWVRTVKLAETQQIVTCFRHDWAYTKVRRSFFVIKSIKVGNLALDLNVEMIEGQIWSYLCTTINSTAVIVIQVIISKIVTTTPSLFACDSILVVSTFLWESGNMPDVIP